MSRYNYNKNFFKEIDNEVKAYWLGFLYADGSITRFYRNEKLKSMSLELTLKEDDKGHLFRFLSDLESNVPIQNKIINDKYKSCRVVINCTSMCRDLINLGCTPQKSLTLEFPNEEVLDKKYHKDFIRGYFDGDGCVYFNKTEVFNKDRNKYYLQNHYNVSFVGTKSFLNSLKDVLKNNDINPNENFYDAGQAKQFYIYGQDNIYRFYQYLYDDSTIYLKRKFNTFQYAFKNIA